MRFPTLQAIASASADIEKRVRLRLIDFASACPEIVGGYFHNLDSFLASKPRGVRDVAQEQFVGQTPELLQAPDEYHAYVNQILYAALHRHSSCTCPGPESPGCTSKQHLSRLRLKWRHQTRDNHVIFDVFFSMTPSPTAPDDAVYWQQLQLHVPRYFQLAHHHAFLASLYTYL